MAVVVGHGRGAEQLGRILRNTNDDDSGARVPRARLGCGKQESSYSVTYGPRPNFWVRWGTSSKRTASVPDRPVTGMA